MNSQRHLALLRIEGDRLAAMSPAALGAPVPAVEGWTLENVVRHTAKVHRWVSAVLAAGPDADLATAAAGQDPVPRGPACLDAYRHALDELMDALSVRDPATEAATFAGPGTVAFWCRRQAHEVAVHRMDAADAWHGIGGPAPDPIATDGAADAIDEWANLFLASRWVGRIGTVPADMVGRSVHIHGTDEASRDANSTPAEWLLSFASDGVEVERTHQKGDVALRGPAADLLLCLWRRRPLSTVEVVGDRDLADRLVDHARF